MASIISELRSVTLSQSTTVFVSELNIKKHNRMAPQHQDTLPKSSDFDIEPSQKSSPVSNLGTSVDSSPPVLSNEDPSETMKENKFVKTDDPSSNDSGSVQNYRANQSEYQSPLMSLQSALKKDGRLGKKLCATSTTSKNHATNNWGGSTPTSMFDRNLPITSSAIIDRNIPASVIHHNGLSSTSDRTYAPLPSIATSNCNSGQLVSTGIYLGNLPSTSSGMFRENLPSDSSEIFDLNKSRREYDSQMQLSDLHYIHCPHCNYTSKTEGRLKRHVKEFHSDTPPESWAGTRTSRMEISNSEQLDNSVTSSNSKTRTFRCKHCSFITYQKSDFWKHSKTHIKPDKRLECEQCDFVTEYKHHYEYHIANHAGRKPFKCSMCNYKCVNKSMLNSHLKSHSSVYQFHCGDCKYETKYCHSIKQHLKKQNHRAGTILNQDGTPCPFQILDVYGRRRGPRVKKRKENTDENCMTLSVPSSNQQTSPSAEHSMPHPPAVSMLRPNIPGLYQSFYGNYSQNLMMRTSPQMNNSGYPMPISGRNLNCFACTMCPFMTSEQDTLKSHMVLHLASENQDFAKIYGINPEYLSNSMNGHRILVEPEESDRKLFASANGNSFSFREELRGYKQEHDMSLDQNMKSEDGSSPNRRNSSLIDDNDSYKDYSSPSPLDSSSHSPDFLTYGNKRDTEDVGTPSFMLDENRMEDNESPIDLSGCKSSDSAKMDKSEDIDMPSSEASTSALTIKVESNASSSQRNRRKGKAYKINHYVQFDEQSSHHEFVKEDMKHNFTAENAKQSCKEQFQNLNKIPTDASGENQNSELLKTVDNHPDLKFTCRSSPASCTDSSPNQAINNLTSSTDNNVKIAVKHLVSIVEHVPADPTFRSERTDDESARSVNHAQGNVDEPARPVNHARGNADEPARPVNHTRGNVDEPARPVNHARGDVDEPARPVNRARGDVDEPAGPVNHAPGKLDEPARPVNRPPEVLYEYNCHHCKMGFGDLAMYSVHMGYHGYMNPNHCNLCGRVFTEALNFFIHIGQTAHT